jgi:1,4-dihydroxy-2-naphthoyl-CoA hydrolase
MKIWKKEATCDQLNAGCKNSMIEFLSIKVVEIGDDYIIATMPVDKRTCQPMGILHGGASIALAETVGSIAANLAVPVGFYCVGIEVNGNHLMPVKNGYIFAKASLAFLGLTTQVWEIKISDEANENVCISRLTMAVIKNNKFKQ